MSGKARKTQRIISDQQRQIAELKAQVEELKQQKRNDEKTALSVSPGVFALVQEAARREGKTDTSFVTDTLSAYLADPASLPLVAEQIQKYYAGRQIARKPTFQITKKCNDALKAHSDTTGLHATKLADLILCAYLKAKLG